MNVSRVRSVRRDHRVDKRRRRAVVVKERQTIRRRLAAAVVANPTGPILGRRRPVLELAERSRATAHGGMATVAKVVAYAGLAEQIDQRLSLLASHRPYFESDHVLNLAYNALCGGICLQDIELRRNDRAFLDGLGVDSLPDPTTAGDFCRRFSSDDVMVLQEAAMAARRRVWAAQGPQFTAITARIDADATIVATTGQTKEGMDISYSGIWGYSALVVSLANTAEPLYLRLFGANRPSHEGVVPLFDRAVEHCREAGFADIMLRGDSDYSLTDNFDRWSDDGVRFVFGYDAKKNLIDAAQDQDGEHYQELVGLTDTALAAAARSEAIAAGSKTARARRPRIKDQVVAERGFRTIATRGEDITEFAYRPRACGRTYRMIALRKDLNITGENLLFSQFRYFFYVSNDTTLSADEIVAEARSRCNQENLHAQLKAARALHAPLDTLWANWAYMAMVALAWSFKAWSALLLPVHPRWADRHHRQRRQVLAMEFRTFIAAFIAIPAQIVTTARQTRWRLLAWNPWLDVLFRLDDSL